jgi:hypothetical protein
VDAGGGDLPRVLLAARSIDPATRRSALYGRRTTSLTWSQERQSWRIGRVIRFWDPDYFRTYVEESGQQAGYMSVQAEVTRAKARPGQARPGDYEDVPAHVPDAWLKRAGLYRDSLEDGRPAFVVRDGNYLAARWPGDVHTFAKQFSAMLEKVPAPPGPAAPKDTLKGDWQAGGHNLTLSSLMITAPMMRIGA